MNERRTWGGGLLLLLVALGFLALAQPLPARAVGGLPPALQVHDRVVRLMRGSLASATGAWSDPDGDLVTLTASEGAVTRNQDGTWAWSVDTATVRAGGRRVRISAQDDQGNTAHSGFWLDVRISGNPMAWGRNEEAQLGDGTTTNRTVPVPVSGLTGVEDLQAGYYHSVALKADGTVWTWGRNANGQLGDGSWIQRSTPAQVSGLSGMVAVSRGSAHSTALKGDGTVWAWGSGGQVGDGTFTQRRMPVQVSGLTSVVALSSTGHHSLALKEDGTVWAWGDNQYGQLGDGTITDRSAPVPVSGVSGVVAVCAGFYHSLALKADGSVWGWGYNSNGQLGNGTRTTTYPFANPTPTQVSGLADVRSLSANMLYSLAVRGDGTVWAWGDIFGGHLGDGTSTTRLSPVQVLGLSGVVAVGAGHQHSLAMKGDGSVWAWGANWYGGLGDGTTVGRNHPVRTSGLTGAFAVSAHHYQSFALQADLSLVPSSTSPAAGGTLSVSWSAIPNPRPLDWIGLFEVGGNDKANLWWHYTGGDGSGSLSLTAPSAAGQYEFRYFRNDGYQRVLSSAPVTVTAGAAATYTLSPSAGSVTAGGALAISWSAPSNSAASDWIGLFKVGAEDRANVWWSYTGGKPSGTLNLNAPPAGTYEFRYYLQDSYQKVQTSSPVTVTGAAYTLIPSAASLAGGAPVSISWTAPSGAASSDWIGLFKVGDGDRANVWWAYTRGAPSGTLNLTAPVQAGEYEFRYYLQDSYQKVHTSAPVTVAGSVYTLTPSSTHVAAGSALSTEWTAPGGSSVRDWVGLFEVGGNDKVNFGWQYTNGAASGTFNLTAPTAPGQYEFRYYLNDGYQMVKSSVPITVP